MTSLLAGTLIMLILFGFGRRLLFLFGNFSPAEALVFSLGLGLGITAYAVLGLGLLGFLTPASLKLLLLGAFFFAATKGKSTCDELAYLSRSIKKDWGKAWIPFVLLGGAAVLATLCGVQAPEISGDSLCYHLHFPKIYLAAHKIPWAMPYEFNAYFPFLMEMLYTMGLGLGGSGLAKFFHFSTGILAASVILVMSRKAEKPWPAWLGALLFITTPGIVNHLAMTYVDVALAAYTGLALLCALRWLETRHIHYLILGGVFSGFMMSIKFLAMVPVSAITLILASDVLRRRQGRMLAQGIFFWGAPALWFSFIWYLRAFLNTGNPVFPYFESVFGSGIKDYSYQLIGIPLKSFFDFLKIIWFMTMHPAEASHPGGIGFSGAGEQLGPAYLALLPFAFYAFKSKRFLPLLFFILYSFIFWCKLGQVLRFFFPYLPVILVLISLGLGEINWQSKRMRILVYALSLLLMTVNTAYALYVHRNTYRLALGLESQAGYLRRYERSFEAARELNRDLPLNAKILVYDETHLFYFDRPIFREDSYFMMTRYSDHLKTPEDSLRYFTSRGFTHFLWVEDPEHPREALEPSLRLASLFQHDEKRLAQFLIPLYTYTFRLPGKTQTRYALYEMAGK